MWERGEGKGPLSYIARVRYREARLSEISSLIAYSLLCLGRRDAINSL